MRRAIEWMVGNHVAANLIMLLILLTGMMSLYGLKQEIFPEITLDKVSIEVVYPGASPDDIETLVIEKIEESLTGVEGIDEIQGTASENRGTVVVSAAFGVDVKELFDDVEAEINRITTFPEDAEDPIVKINETKSIVIQVGVFGDLSEKELVDVTELVKDELIKRKDISQVGISGLRNYEISIELSEESLRQYGISFEQVTNAVKSSSLDLPGGKIKTTNGEILLRTQSLGYVKEDYEKIILKSDPNGNTVTIKDVANVVDAFEDSDVSTSFDLKPAALITVYRSGEETPIAVADSVKEYIELSKYNLPDKVTLTAWNDQSVLLKQRINLLLRNAAIGLLLVMFSLSLFLHVRLAFWVSMGIVISFVGTFIVMSLFGVSINMITLFAFILVLGIVVDDAIVVGENIFSEHKEGVPLKLASSKATVKVAMPVTFAVLTTVATFSPMLFVDGNMGKIMKVIPIVVIAVLLFSLFESLFILPVHLSGIKESSHGFFAFLNKLSDSANILLDKFIRMIYAPFLEKSLKYRYTTIAVALSFLLISVGLIGGGILKFNFLPDVEGDNIVVLITMPAGTSVSQTEKVVKRFEDAAMKVQNEYELKYPHLKGKLFKHMFRLVGDQPSLKHGPNGGRGGAANPSLAEINLQLVSVEQRPFGTTEVLEKWREYSGDSSEAKSILFQNTIMNNGNDIEYQLSAPDNKLLTDAVEEFKKIIAEFGGTSEIRDDFDLGKYEYKLKLKPSAATLGVTTADIAKQVRQGYYGSEALTVQRGGEQVKVMIRYSESERRNIDSIKNMRIRTKSGAQIPLTSVAEIQFGRGVSKINRLNRERIISVIANVDELKVNPNEVNKELKKKLNKMITGKYKSLSFTTAGAQKQQQKSMISLGKGFIVALFVLYLLLAIPFRSYSQPLIIMSAIPFGIIGAIMGHLLMGFTLSIMSVFGIVALAGVVVNDSLVLIDAINVLQREHEKGFIDAIITGAQRRFRPIMLTSLTTFLGLAPMIVETEMQARFLVPMAISLGFGILFATVITLVFIPSVMVVLDEVKSIFKKREA